jgi:hypothetical protein
MTEESVNAHVSISNQVRYKLEVVRNGEIICGTEFRDNMLTDFGLDDITVQAIGWLNALNVPRLGNGVSPSPVRRDSGAITFTQSGTTLTASSTFFVADDTGRLFKWGTGSTGAELYLTYNSGTQCTVSASATVSTPTIGTIWYVNVSSLTSYISTLRWAPEAGADKNYSTASVAGDIVTITHQNVQNSSAFSSGTSITEIGFNPYYYGGTQLYDLDIVNPPVAFLTGDQARVTLQVIQTISGLTPVAASNVGTGYDSSGTVQLESTGLSDNGLETFDSNGNPQGYNGTLDPGNNVGIGIVYGNAITLQPFNTFNGTYFYTGSFFSQSSTKADSYGTGSHYRDVAVVWSISNANTTLYAVSFGNSYRQFTLVFNTPFVKTSSQTLTVRFRKSWSRVLVN